MLQRVLSRTFGSGNEKALKARIKSVSSIGKITKAMKMVAAAKMRAEISRLVAGGNFGHNLATNWFKGDDTARRFLPELGPEARTLLVPFTSDRGLCGGVNSGIIREIKAMAGKKREKYAIFAIGEKGTLALTRPFPDLLYKSITNILTPVSYATASAIAQALEAAAKEKSCQRIELIFNEFKNVVTSKIKRSEVISRSGFRLGHHKSTFEVEEPDFPLATEVYYDLYLASSVYHAMLNSASSEQSARMTAMEGASKNCNQMIGKLQLEYNKVRQAKITMELCEIISGAEAL
jgi:F-type H+-transporting ATPase subunit gamma